MQESENAMDEIELIETHLKPLAHTSGALGLSDDVARLQGGQGRSIVTCDALIESVHFLPGDPLATVARKLIAVNVSDIRCKGALPGEALLVLGVPRGLERQAIAEFARGLGEALEAYDVSLIGGDTVRSPSGLIVSLTLTGRCIGPGPVLRSGAKTGDDIWISGEIGHGALGLAAALSGEDGPRVHRYRVPEIAPAAMAELVARYGHAAMDISDGLIGDTARLLSASGQGGHLALDSVPLAAPCRSPEEAMPQFTGGDDYQVLMTSEPANRQAIEAYAGANAISISRIGAVESETGLRLSWQGEPVGAPGKTSYRHG